jgi:hypothetical protein
MTLDFFNFCLFSKKIAFNALIYCTWMMISMSEDENWIGMLLLPIAKKLNLYLESPQ